MGHMIDYLYADFRTVFLFSVCILDVLSFRFEAIVAKTLIFQNLKSKRLDIAVLYSHEPLLFKTTNDKFGYIQLHMIYTNAIIYHNVSRLR